jgi:hypothetical protein
MILLLYFVINVLKIVKLVRTILGVILALKFCNLWMTKELAHNVVA